MYYGIAAAPVDNTNPLLATTAKMNGLRSILQTNNITVMTNTTPVNASAYGSSDLLRDTLQSARQNGGDPDLLGGLDQFHERFCNLGQPIERSLRARPCSARRSTCSKHPSCTG